MTDEDAFHAALNANPNDFICRLAFADWLEERGDPRAAGYREMGSRRLAPEYYGDNFPLVFPFTWIATNGESHDCFLNRLWLSKIVGGMRSSHSEWVDFSTRRAAEDAAALAFAELEPS